jgi:hypothetical protein
MSPTRLEDFGLSGATLAGLRSIGLADLDRLLEQPAGELVRRGLDRIQLYEIICQLERHELSLPPIGEALPSLPTERDWEMLRLRLLHGMTLREVGREIGIGHERVRQLLRLRFGLLDMAPGHRADRIVARSNWPPGGRRAPDAERG